MHGLFGLLLGRVRFSCHILLGLMRLVLLSCVAGSVLATVRCIAFLVSCLAGSVLAATSVLVRVRSDAFGFVFLRGRARWSNCSLHSLFGLLLGRVRFNCHIWSRSCWG